MNALEVTLTTFRLAEFIHLRVLCQVRVTVSLCLPLPRCEWLHRC